MKKLLTNWRFLHVFYIANLLIMSYLLWYVYPAKEECMQAESNALTLNVASEAINSSCSWVREEIFQYAKAYSNARNKALIETVDILNQKHENAVLSIENVKKILVDDLKNNSNWCYHKNSTLPSRNILTNDRIAKMKTSFEFYKDTSFSNRLDERDWQELKKTILDIENRILWHDMNKLSASSAIAQLEAIKTNAKLIQFTILNFLYKTNGPCLDIKFDRFAVVLAPFQAAIKVGEPFKADLALYNYASYFDSNYHILIDDKELPTENGVAHYEKVFQKAGKYKIIAQAIRQDSLTGQVENATREYQIEVLPK
jgi:hypothetical protein